MTVIEAVFVLAMVQFSLGVNARDGRMLLSAPLTLEGPANCATNSAVLDTLAQKTPSDEPIIVIARLGKSETKRGLNQRRLHNVKTYLTEYTSVEGGRRKRSRIIVAEGGKVDGYGQVEFFVAGKPAGVLSIKNNGDLIVGTCYPDPVERDPCTLRSDKNFYPCLDRSSRTRRSQLALNSSTILFPSSNTGSSRRSTQDERWQLGQNTIFTNSLKVASWRSTDSNSNILGAAKTGVHQST